MKTPGEIMCEYEVKEERLSPSLSQLIHMLEDYLKKTYCRVDQVVDIRVYQDIHSAFSTIPREDKIKVIKNIRDSGWKVKGKDLDFTMWSIKMCSDVAPWYVKWRV